MNENRDHQPRERPFPWRCIRCREKLVSPLKTPYTGTMKHDGMTHVLNIPDLPIPTCRNCGEQVFSVEEDTNITTALRRQIGLLLPAEIAQARSQLQISQLALAEQIGVSTEMIANWESGMSVQSRAMDNLLRLFFQSADARRLLSTRFEREAVAKGVKPMPTVA